MNQRLAPGLPGNSFYATLPRDARERLRAAAVTRTFQPGDRLTMEDQPSSQVMIVLSGWAKATFVTRGGDEVVLRIYGPGDLFSAEAVLAGRRCAESVTAIARCSILVLAGERFTSLLTTSPGIARAFSLAMLHRAQAADEQIKLRHTPPHVRIACGLLELAGRSGTQVPDGITFPLELSQEELASWLGTSRSTISRTLHSLRRRGLIRTGYRTITITGADELHQIATASGEEPRVTAPPAEGGT
jgi:CRP-like cAMP-binding protein